MGFSEIFLIALGLSMDAFAVSVCKGLGMKKLSYKNTLLIGAFFGGFQAIMPLVGWLLGTQFESYITAFDHWIAFVLLGIIGGKMIWESCKTDTEECAKCENPKIRELFILAVATSIDALAVGITLAFLRVNIWKSISVIGVVTFIISMAGVVIGNRFGSKYKRRAELAGGIILMIMGVKILMDHLGFV